MKISLHRRSDLPKKGWLQSCISCHLYTSKEYYIAKAGEVKVYAILCKDCKQSLRRNPLNIKKLKDLCDSYIISQWSHIHQSLASYRPDFLPLEHGFPRDLEHTTEIDDTPARLYTQPPPSPHRISRDPPLL
jgi:hypothetical protein